MLQIVTIFCFCLSFDGRSTALSKYMLDNNQHCGLSPILENCTHFDVVLCHSLATTVLEPLLYIWVLLIYI